MAVNCWECGCLRTGKEGPCKVCGASLLQPSGTTFRCSTCASLRKTARMLTPEGAVCAVCYLGHDRDGSVPNPTRPSRKHKFRAPNWPWRGVP